MLFDVFKGAILMLRKEGRRGFDEALHSKQSYFSLRRVPVRDLKKKTQPGARSLILGQKARKVRTLGLS